MAAIPEIYADGVGTIRLAAGMIRADLVSVGDGEPDAQGRPPTEVHHRLVMTPQAFLQSLNMMQQLVNKLVDAGVMRREPTPNGAPIATTPPASPNF